MRVEALAASLGVSKGGFYWHFTDRQALLDEMLDTWEKAGTEDVIARVDSQPADPRAKLQQLFELAPSADFAVELALRDWSRRDEDVAERLHRVDNRRMEYLRSLFGQFCADEDDVEARSMLAFSLFIGSYFIAAQHADKTPVPGAAARDRPAAQRVVGLRWPECGHEPSRATGARLRRGLRVLHELRARSSRGSGRTRRSSPGSSPIWTSWESPRSRRPTPCSGSRSTARSARATRRSPRADSRRRIWKIVGRVLLLPGISWIAARAYRLVARQPLPAARGHPRLRDAARS